MASSSRRILHRTSHYPIRLGSRRSRRHLSSQTSSRIGTSEGNQAQAETSKQGQTAAQTSSKDPPTKPKTQAEIDAALREKLSGLAGDGGESGVEYEDGKPVSMKRGVRNNMFRYI